MLEPELRNDLERKARESGSNIHIASAGPNLNDQFVDVLQEFSARE